MLDIVVQGQDATVPLPSPVASYTQDTWSKKLDHVKFVTLS